MKKSLLLLTLLAARLAAAQSYTAPGGAVPDNNTVTAFPLTVSGLAPAATSASFGVQSVRVTINHPYVGDLRVQVQAPDGTVADLSSNNGGNGQNYANTTFVGTGTNSVANGSAPFSGSYRAQGILGSLNNGQNPNGTWQLLVRDTSPGDVGSLAAWALNFSANPAPPFAFTTSNLPIVVIDTHGGLIVDSPKIDAHMGIISHAPGVPNGPHDAFNAFSNKIGIEIRGSSSQSFPQKSFSLETRDAANVQHDTTLLGMPTENAWILYAPYDDKTCLRNVLSYHIANRSGHYAARTRYFELIINGQYQGIYVLLEKIKRDAGRVNIKKMDPVDTVGDKLTGGYIIKIDKPTGSGGNSGWDSRFRSSTNSVIRFLYDTPKDVDIVPQQARYIQAYLDSVETALAAANFASPAAGYAKYLDVPSFLDYFLLNEVSRNVDGLRLSTYLHKNRRSQGGKLRAGPAWDYNLAWWNANYCAGNQATGWAYNFNQVCPNDPSQVPFWWARLLQDPAYTAALRCRWTYLRQHVLHRDTLNAFLDAQAQTLNAAQARHFVAWPILGQYTWPNPSPIPATYPAEIAALKSWLGQRLAWLDVNMPGTCPAIVTASSSAAEALALQVFPNPFGAALKLGLTLPQAVPVQVAVLDMQGRRVAEADFGLRPAGRQELGIEAAALPPGLYVLQARLGQQVLTRRVAKQ